MNELAKMQAAIKAPKGQFNNFGKYKYRSCEDIVEAIKPVINPMGFSLTLSDEIVNIGNRFYIKATAMLTNGEQTFSVSAFAREEETKKGMDGSQITGAASSYARKYALNGLFAIDDTKDADTEDPKIHKESVIDGPAHQLDQKPVTLHNHKEIVKDNKPLIPMKALKQALERITAGELDVYYKVTDAFSLEETQKRLLKQTYDQAKEAKQNHVTTK